MSANGVVIVGAGSSARMGGADKLFALLAGQPLLLHSLDAAQRCEMVQQIVLVVATQRLEETRCLLAAQPMGKLRAIVPGGARRQDSVMAGLAALAGVEYVAIHDAARPLVTPALFGAGFAAVAATGAAIAAVPVVDTLKRAAPDGSVEATVSREGLWAVQTPQVFRYELLLAAHRGSEGDVTDDAMLLEALGQPVRIFPGSVRNVKVTTPDDLALAAALLARQTD
ncbi:MAG TPA: 2-C-methyl-D-erythritol 4-phosphate cytidylyltransferase [Dehalococcoidia bacterium]|nr:2-C-methyl-D-erythritol 4-phosphate cytidylyltransferase [Dehalococcoidia bacterium]